MLKRSFALSAIDIRQLGDQLEAKNCKNKIDAALTKLDANPEDLKEFEVYIGYVITINEYETYKEAIRRIARLEVHNGNQAGFYYHSARCKFAYGKFLGTAAMGAFEEADWRFKSAIADLAKVGQKLASKDYVELANKLKNEVEAVIEPNIKLKDIAKEKFFEKHPRNKMR